MSFVSRVLQLVVCRLSPAEVAHLLSLIFRLRSLGMLPRPSRSVSQFHAYASAVLSVPPLHVALACIEALGSPTLQSAVVACVGQSSRVS